MRMLFEISFPHDEFNEAVENGSAGDMLERILKETKPEAIYFTNIDKQRGAIAIMDVKKASDIPSLCEPWFLLFNADIEMKVCMTPKDLGAANLDDLGEKWS